MISQTFNGKKWEKFNSEKVASLAYARIQGKTALISHFQNSSLMNEDKRCHPILFHSAGPDAGSQVRPLIFYLLYFPYRPFPSAETYSKINVIFPSQEPFPPGNINTHLEGTSLMNSLDEGALDKSKAVDFNEC